MTAVKAIEKTPDQVIHDLKNRIASMHFEAKYRKNEVLYEPVTYDEYAKAVVKLFELAHMDCGGSYHAAQVLLSLFNGGEFHVDLARMTCNLDTKYLNAALVAIKGRGQLMIEPHQVIQDGSKHFENLWRQWESLHVRRRYQDYYAGGV